MASEGATRPAVRRIDHVAIRVSDLEDAIEFYGDRLGMAIEDAERYSGPDWTSGEETPYVATVAGSPRIHVWPTGGEPVDVPTREHICIVLRSSDLDPREELASFLGTLRPGGSAQSTTSPSRARRLSAEPGRPTSPARTVGPSSSASTEPGRRGPYCPDSPTSAPRHQ